MNRALFPLGIRNCFVGFVSSCVLLFSSEAHAYDLFRYLVRTPYSIQYPTSGGPFGETEDQKKLDLLVQKKANLDHALAVTLVLHAANISVDFLYPSFIRTEEGPWKTLHQKALYPNHQVQLTPVLLRPNTSLSLPFTKPSLKDAQNLFRMLALAYALKVPPQRFKIRAINNRAFVDIDPRPGIPRHLFTIDLVHGFSEGILGTDLSVKDYLNQVNDPWINWAAKVDSSFLFEATEINKWTEVLRSSFQTVGPKVLRFLETPFIEDWIPFGERLQKFVGYYNPSILLEEEMNFHGTHWRKLPDINNANKWGTATPQFKMFVERWLGVFYKEETEFRTNEYFENLVKNMVHLHYPHFGTEGSDLENLYESHHYPQTGIRQGIKDFVFLYYIDDEESLEISKIIKELQLSKFNYRKTNENFSEISIEGIAEYLDGMPNLVGKTLVLFEPRFESEIIYQSLLDRFPDRKIIIFDHHGQNTIKANDRWNEYSTLEQFSAFIGYELDFAQRFIALMDRGLMSSLPELAIDKSEATTVLKNHRWLKRPKIDANNYILTDEALNWGSLKIIWNKIYASRDEDLNMRDLKNHLHIQRQVEYYPRFEDYIHVVQQKRFHGPNRFYTIFEIDGPTAFIREFIDHLPQTDRIKFMYFGSGTRLKLTINIAFTPIANNVANLLRHLFSSVNRGQIESNYRKFQEKISELRLPDQKGSVPECVEVSKLAEMRPIPSPLQLLRGTFLKIGNNFSNFLHTTFVRNK